MRPGYDMKKDQSKNISNILIVIIHDSKYNNSEYDRNILAVNYDVLVK